MEGKQRKGKEDREHRTKTYNIPPFKRKQGRSEKDPIGQDMREQERRGENPTQLNPNCNLNDVTFTFCLREVSVGPTEEEDGGQEGRIGGRKMWLSLITKGSTHPNPVTTHHTFCSLLREVEALGRGGEERREN